jgi:hypothetical protein
MRYFWGMMLGSLLTSIVWMWQMDRMITPLRERSNQAQIELQGTKAAMNTLRDMNRQLGLMVDMERQRIANLSQFICGNDGKLVIGENSYTCGKK